MSLEDLRREVWRANLDLAKYGLAVLTWGNASGIDRSRGLVAIKPSGVPYDRLRPQDLVVVDLDGRIAEGELRPSSDTPIHLELYRAWPSVGGIAHTHSAHAVMFAQAWRPIPCLGTTHADAFRGDVPITRELTPREVDEGYEKATGVAIVECFDREKRDPLHTPAVLAPGHGPFAWGADAPRAAENALILEEVARMAFGALLLRGTGKLAECGPERLPGHMADKHFHRKHGPAAYYGQPRVPTK